MNATTTVDLETAMCGAMHDVTAGAGAWDTGTCYRRAGHGGDHDYQVEPPTPSRGAFEEVVRDWCDKGSHYAEPGTTQLYTGDRGPAAARACAGCVELMRAAVLARETFCPDCNYLSALHLNGRCPTEAEARERSGAS